MEEPADLGSRPLRPTGSAASGRGRKVNSDTFKGLALLPLSGKPQGKEDSSTSPTPPNPRYGTKCRFLFLYCAIDGTAIVKAGFEMRLRSVSSSAVVLLEQTTQNGHLADDGAAMKWGKVRGIIFPAAGTAALNKVHVAFVDLRVESETVFELLRVVGKKSCLPLRFSRN